MEGTVGDDSSTESLSDFVSCLMEDIYKSCCVGETEDSVLVSSLIEYLRPHMVHIPTGISNIQQLLDPTNENPTVTKQLFYETMHKWIASIKEYENNSRGSSVSERKFFPFSQSTPTKSSSEENISNTNVSTVSPTSFDGDKSNSSVERDVQLLRQQLKSLNIAHSSTLNELSAVKQQLATAEHSVLELRADLERTSRRLSHEQQLNTELQKCLENKDDSSEEKTEAMQKISDLQKIVSSTKKENSTLISAMKLLEIQIEENEIQIVESRKKDELRLKELANLRASLEEYEEENKTLSNELKNTVDKLEEQKRQAEHQREISEIYRCELDALREANKISNKRRTRNSLPSMHSALTRSPKKAILSKITPFKNLYRPSEFDREIFNSPVFLRQLSSPISPDGLDTPTRSEKLSPVEKESANSKQVSFSEEADESEYVTENELLSVVDDSFDLSGYSELDSLKGQSLMSELKACTFFNNSNNSINNEETLKKIKEHENCQILLEEYQETIRTFEEKLRIAIDEKNCLSENMEKTNFKNAELLDENTNLRKKLDEQRDEELIKTLESQVEYNEISEELERIRNLQENERSEYNNLQQKYDCLIHEKETLQKLLEEIKCENSILAGKLNEVKETIVSKDNEIDSINQQKMLLEEKIFDMKNEQDKNSREIEICTEKLRKITDIGKQNVEDIKIKTTNLETKVQFLNEYTETLSKSLDDLQEEHQLIKSKLKLFQTEDSSSTDGNDERPLYRRKSRKRSDNELQFKINKYEDHINFLERKLSTEKVKQAQIFKLKTRLDDVEREKFCIADEKYQISKKLEEMQKDLKMKEEMYLNIVSQNELLSLEIEEMRVTKNELYEKIATLEKNLSECLDEKFQLSLKVEKKNNKIFALMKSVADMEKPVNGQESTKHKSTSSLESVQKRVVDLELLQSKSNIVLLETTKIFRATRTIYWAWKHSLDSNANEQLFRNAETLDVDEIPHELTEEDIWKVHQRLIVTCQLLEALASNVRPKDEHGFSRNISKFTMKNELFRLPSCDPDISSSIKEDFSISYKEHEISETENGTVFGEHNESSDSTLFHRTNRRIPSLKELHDASTDSMSCKSLVIRTTKLEVPRRMNSTSIKKYCFFFLIFCAVFVTSIIALNLQLQCIRNAKSINCPMEALSKDNGELKSPH